LAIGSASGLHSSTSFVAALLLDGSLGKGLRLEARIRDQRAGFDRSPVAAPCDSPLGPLYGSKLVAKVGGEGDVDRFGIERGTRVFVLPGLLTLQGTHGPNLAPYLGERGFDARSYVPDELACASIVHDHLLA